MSTDAEKSRSKYRFILIQPFHIPEDSEYAVAPGAGPKEHQLLNFTHLKGLLQDVQWDLDPGPEAPHGPWPVENREEFTLVAAARLARVRAACESGRYNAIILLGGGEPGLDAAREIARQYSIPVVGNASSQMHIACILGNRFSVIDISESHNMHYYSLVVAHRMTERCASIRSVNYPMPRPPHTGEPVLVAEAAIVARGGRSEGLERAVAESVAAIEEDGAEVIMLGCAATFWLRPHLETRLNELGWEVPVLDGYSASIALAKLMVDLGVDASGLTYPKDRPAQWRRKKTF